MSLQTGTPFLESSLPVKSLYHTLPWPTRHRNHHSTILITMTQKKNTLILHTVAQLAIILVVIARVMDSYKVRITVLYGWLYQMHADKKLYLTSVIFLTNQSMYVLNKFTHYNFSYACLPVILGKWHGRKMQAALQQWLLPDPRGGEKRFLAHHGGVPRVGGVPGLHTGADDQSLRQWGQCAATLGRAWRGHQSGRAVPQVWS